MVTTRSLRAEKRTAAKALGGSVLTNKVRFTQLESSEQQPTPVLRELMYHKNRLQHQVVNLQDYIITQAATIKDLTEEVVQYRTLLHNVEPQYSEAKKDEDTATLKSVIQNLTADNETLGSMYAELINEQKQLFNAANTAGQGLADAVRTLRVPVLGPGGMRPVM